VVTNTRSSALQRANETSKEAFRVLDADAVADECARKIAVPLQQRVDLLAQQLGWGVAEYVFRRGVQPLNRPVESRRDDGVGRGIDDGMVTRVLPFAQNPLAGHRYGNVIDLQQAMRGPSRREGADHDIVQQILSGFVPQRQERVERMRQDAGATDLDRFLDHRRKSGFAQARKYIEQILAEDRLLGVPADAPDPIVPADDAAACVEHDNADIQCIKHRPEPELGHVIQHGQQFAVRCPR
jgi:hypothetical protein